MSEREVGTILIHRDHVAEVLDDLAALGEYWTRNRERGRMPNSIRHAMLIAAREALMYAEAAAEIGKGG